jgi:tetratricopeptide (TPR) repeat protein
VVKSAGYGMEYENEERLIEAERAYSQALSIFRRIPDKNYETAAILSNLASIYSLNRRYSDALKVLVEAPKLLKKNTPDEQALTAQLLNSRGMVYFRQGKLRAAEALLAEALEMRSLAGVDSDNIEAQILSNLGSVYQKQHKYGKAEESYTRSLAITEQRLGPMHPYLTLTLGNLGGLYTELRRYSETGDQYRRSLTILEQMTPAPDARIVRTLHWLAKNYIQLGEKTSAESALARAVEIARHNRVPNPEMPMLLDAYGDILKSLGKVQEALASAHRSPANPRRYGFDGSRAEREIAVIVQVSTHFASEPGGFQWRIRVTGGLFGSPVAAFIRMRCPSAETR